MSDEQASAGAKGSNGVNLSNTLLNTLMGFFGLAFITWAGVVWSTGQQIIEKQEKDTTKLESAIKDLTDKVQEGQLERENRLSRLESLMDIQQECCRDINVRTRSLELHRQEGSR